jgi:5-methylcytosine-specific restriction endonuclease McrA
MWFKENRRFIKNYLVKHPCVHCGETDPVVLEFDHLRDKKMAVSRLLRRYSPKMVKEEIAKCQVLCANCHRRKTAADQKWFKSE